MTQPNRPPLARKHTRTTEQTRAGALDQGIAVTIDDERYEVRLGEVTSTVTRELRARSGMSFNALISEVQSDPDTDSIAAFVWLARRLRGEDVDFNDVVVTYAQILADGFDVDLAGAAPEDGDFPEA